MGKSLEARADISSVYVCCNRRVDELEKVETHGRTAGQTPNWSCPMAVTCHGPTKTISHILLFCVTRPLCGIMVLGHDAGL